MYTWNRKRLYLLLEEKWLPTRKPVTGYTPTAIMMRTVWLTLTLITWEFTFLAHNEISSTSDLCSISSACFLLPQDTGGVQFSPYSSIETQGTNSDYYETLFDQSQIQKPRDAYSSLTVGQKQKFTITAVSPEYCYANEATKVYTFLFLLYYALYNDLWLMYVSEC